MIGRLVLGLLGVADRGFPGARRAAWWLARRTRCDAIPPTPGDRVQLVASPAWAASDGWPFGVVGIVDADEWSLSGFKLIDTRPNNGRSEQLEKLGTFGRVWPSCTRDALVVRHVRSEGDGFKIVNNGYRSWIVVRGVGWRSSNQWGHYDNDTGR